MDKNKKKNIELNVAIAVALILLVSVMIIFRNTKEKKASPMPEEKESISKSKTMLPSKTKDVEELDFLKKEKPLSEQPVEPEQKAYEEIMVPRDLPLDSIPEETRDKIIEESKETTTLKTQPSYEDMKALQKKNLIIY